MKKTIYWLLFVTLLGCGDKKYKPPLTPLEQKLAKLDEKVAEWEQRKKNGKRNSYSMGYNRMENGEPYYVDMIFKDGKFVCRQKTTFYEVFLETGTEINSHDWDNTLARTIESIHEECRKSVMKNPEALFNYSWGGDLVWCQGNFGIAEPMRGVVHFGAAGRTCTK